jgi:hypothetical protein
VGRIRTPRAEAAHHGESHLLPPVVGNPQVTPLLEGRVRAVHRGLAVCHLKTAVPVGEGTSALLALMEEALFEVVVEAERAEATAPGWQKPQAEPGGCLEESPPVGQRMVGQSEIPVLRAAREPSGPRGLQEQAVAEAAGERTDHKLQEAAAATAGRAEEAAVAESEEETQLHHTGSVAGAEMEVRGVYGLLSLLGPRI